MKNPTLRAELLELMTDSAFKRLLPEVFHEANEIRFEISRLHPEWLRAQPDLNSYQYFLQDWNRLKGGFWDRVKENSDEEIAALQTLGDNEQLSQARQESKSRRGAARQASWDFNSFSLNNVPGVDGVEEWRFAGFKTTTIALLQQRGPWIDWLGTHIDITRMLMSQKAWKNFFLHEIELDNVPRMWIRWAFETLQSMRKVTDGAPCDTQLATYLLDCDQLITSDRAFAEISWKCDDYHNWDTGKVILVRAGASALEELDSLLDM